MFGVKKVKYFYRSDRLTPRPSQFFWSLHSDFLSSHDSRRLLSNSQAFLSGCDHCGVELSFKPFPFEEGAWEERQKRQKKPQSRRRWTSPDLCFFHGSKAWDSLSQASLQYLLNLKIIKPKTLLISFFLESSRTKILSSFTFDLFLKQLEWFLRFLVKLKSIKGAIKSLNVSTSLLVRGVGFKWQLTLAGACDVKYGNLCWNYV